MGGIGGGYTPGYQSPYGSLSRRLWITVGYASRFWSCGCNRPTRMLVGEAGPEFVSVIPMKGRNKKNPPRSIPKTASRSGMGPTISVWSKLWLYMAKGSGRLTQKKKRINAKYRPLCSKAANKDHSKDHNKAWSKVCQECSKQYKKAHNKESKKVCSKAGRYPRPHLIPKFQGAGRFTWGGGRTGHSVRRHAAEAAHNIQWPLGYEFVWYRYKI